MLGILYWYQEKQRYKKRNDLKKKLRKKTPINCYDIFYLEGKPVQTKQDLAEARYGKQTIDYALPQGWVDACKEKGFDVVPHFVWLYDDYVGRPASLTDEGDRMLSLLARTVS
jgi:hypothetical protein